MFPFDILLERLKHYDEVTLLELLDISSEELIQMFAERIKERRQYLEKELEIVDEAEILADDLDTIYPEETDLEWEDRLD